MAKKDEEKREGETAAPETADSPLLDLSDAAVKRMIKLAKARGFVTLDELNAVLPSDDVNAFACGGQLVVVTSYALEALPRDELSGVLAHELSHHLGLHTVALTVAQWMSVPVLLLARIGFFLQNVAAAATTSFVQHSSSMTALGRLVAGLLTAVSWVFLSGLIVSNMLANVARVVPIQSARTTKDQTGKEVLNIRLNTRNQRPEPWSIYNTKLRKGEHFRVFPLSNWTEVDVWAYIQREGLRLPNIYFAHEREVFVRDGMLMAAAVFVERLPNEDTFTETVRFRTVGDITCTCPVESPAATAADIVIETLAADVSERGATRMDDKTSDASMEKRKKDGYF